MGGGGGKGGGGGQAADPAWAQTWYDEGYQQGMTGGESFQIAPSVAALDRSLYGTYGQQGFAAGQAAFQQNQMMEQLQAQMAAANEALLTEPEQTGPSMAAVFADAQRRQAAQAQQLQAAQMRYNATKTVDAEIERERSNARLRGIEYSITPEQRQARIDAMVNSGGVSAPVEEVPPSQSEIRRGVSEGTAPLVLEEEDETLDMLLELG